MTDSKYKEVLDRIVEAYRSLLIDIRKQACTTCQKKILDTIQKASRKLAEESRLEWVDRTERKTQ